MRQHLAQQPRGEMPQVSGPDPLDREPLAELGEDRLDPVADARNAAAPLGRRVARPLLEGHQHLDAPPPQPLAQLRRPVGAVGEADACRLVRQLLQDRQVGHPGRRHAQARHHAGPTEARVEPEAVDGRFGGMILSVARCTAEAAAAWGAPEAADRQREAVGYRPTWVAARFGQESLPERLLDLPQVRSLAREGRAMHAGEGREEVGVVAAEVSEDLRVTVEAEVLADDLDGEHLGVGQHGARPALAQPPRHGPRQSVVNEAEDGYNERVQVHTAPPKGTVQRLPFKGAWAWTFNFSNN